MIVNLTPTEEQQLVEDSIRGLLADKLPVDRLREAHAHGGAVERAIWGDLVELGLFGLGLAEERGGIGYGLPEEVIVAKALGAHLASPSIVAQMIAVHLADDATRPALMSGEARAAFVNAFDGGAHLIDGEGATHAVVVGKGGAALVAIDSLGAAEPVELIDETVAVAKVSTDAALSGGAEVDRLSLLLATYMAGLAGATRDMAVDYAKTREQFGQPIGAFQAIKHQCADLALRAAGAETQCYHTAVTFGRGNDDGVEVACARLLAGEAALANAKQNIQIHGGMGFTAECDAHLFLKRAHLISMLGTSKVEVRKRILA
ncbi:acyl-CoA dehydrogenase family protein [Sphingomonas crocodyli]|nr:acyl-CoA dehydrogenase family protein [Sphingomonas crocodyli]